MIVRSHLSLLLSLCVGLLPEMAVYAGQGHHLFDSNSLHVQKSKEEQEEDRKLEQRHQELLTKSGMWGNEFVRNLDATDRELLFLRASYSERKFLFYYRKSGVPEETLLKFRDLIEAEKKGRASASTP